MPIRKLNSTDDHDWINSSLQEKGDGLDPDMWSDATRIASKLLFIDKLDKQDTIYLIAKQFRTSSKEAKTVIEAVLKAEAEPITIWNPTVRAKAIKSDTNMRLIRADLINEVHCSTEQGMTVTAAKNDQGEVYTIMSAFEVDEAVSNLTPYFDEALGVDYKIAVFALADNYYGLEEWLQGVDQYYSSMGFSHNLLRGVAEEQTPELSIDLFEGVNNRRPFSQ